MSRSENRSATPEGAGGVPEVLYHFTSLVHLREILLAGHLRPHPCELDASARWPALVWLTDDPDYLHQLWAASLVDKAATRIQVHTEGLAITPWTGSAVAGQIDATWRGVLERIGGNSTRWFYTRERIERARFAAIELRDGIDYARMGTGELAELLN